MCYCGTHLQGRKGNKIMDNLKLEKELIKSRLMDFIFDDEYARIEDKDAFYNATAIDFRNNLDADDNLEAALSAAIFSNLFITCAFDFGRDYMHCCTEQEFEYENYKFVITYDSDSCNVEVVCKKTDPTLK